MDVAIRPVEEHEFEAFFRSLVAAFGEEYREGDAHLWRKVLDPSRTLAAFEDDRIVATAADFPFLLTVPAGQVSMPGVTMVGVQPSHRRRGILTQLMRRQLDGYRDQGEAISGLWASEAIIYGRFGYGLAAFVTNLEIPRHRAQYALPHEPSGRVRLVEKEEALKAFADVYDRVLLTHPGMLSRSPEWWEVIYADLEHWREGATPLFYAVHQSANGEPDGYVSYRLKHEWDKGHELRVNDLVAATPEAYADLWRLCLDHDLVGKIQAWPRQVDEPLLHLLAHPRELQLKLGDGLWLRLIDVGQALESRRYSAQGALVVDVRDSFCPWNQGRYLLDGGPEGASCRPTDREADLRLDVRDLAAGYLGGVRFQTLARARRVEEATEGAARRADAMFGWNPLPWVPHLF